VLDFDPESGLFHWKPRGVTAWDRRWAGKRAFISDTHGYRTGSLFGETGVLAHRVAWKIHYGDDPRGEVDHINGDRADNRICNLRVVSTKDNRRNAAIPRHNTSGSVGVRFKSEKRKWQAYISEGNRYVHLGYFTSRDDAIAARKQAEVDRGFHPNHGREARAR